MGASNDLLLGRIAVELGYALPAQVEECIRTQEATRVPLGQILVDRGFVTKEQLGRIVAEQERRLNALDPATQRRKEAVLFGKLASREGYVTVEAVNECLALQARPGEQRTLGEILVGRGYLTTRQVQDLLKKQLKKIMQCERCRLRFTVLTLTEGKNARCPKCKGPLVEVQKTDNVKTDAEFTTTILKAVQGPAGPVLRPVATVKTTCVVCEAGFEAAQDETGRVRCPLCKSSFVPK
ncbi:MAG: hypothetical protein HYY17_01995 [Planctomycetes bacterium]|nr:hypothetical protein [Planctomycetota bacterium]